MKKNLFKIVCLFGFVAIASNVFAEVITLRNGKVVEGDIVEDNDQFIKVSIHGMKLTYYKDQIRSIGAKSKSSLKSKSSNLSSKASARYTVRSIRHKLYTIPKFGNNSNRNITGVSVNGSTLNFATRSSWGEASLGRADIKFDGFMAATGDFQIQAVGSDSIGRVAIYDANSRSIHGAKGTAPIKIPSSIKASGMTNHQQHYWLCDKSKAKIYKLGVNGTSAKIIAAYPAPGGVSGLASDGNNIYSCAGNTIYKHDSSMKVIEAYKSNVNISSLSCLNSNTFIAADSTSNKMYILSK